ncbi:MULTISPECIES: hypothetical protein [unclassified Streptomyces]|uniref:hypothetical protein n=1 Tax=unclassified Streptomyces TaxID=2593676 RepID=UPI000B626579|nr:MULTISPECIES: hypothetical protein [unclassified Streptomyces]SNB89909.1 hypothetical protein SAMN02745831_06203 [Streptomyces sp. PgraA7]
MTRLQILELPEGTDDERPPFVLVVDEYTAQRVVTGAGQTITSFADPIEQAADRIGARGTLVFAETVEIPANEAPADPDGYPLRLAVEADLTGFGEQVTDAILKARSDAYRIAAQVSEKAHSPLGVRAVLKEYADENAAQDIHRMDAVTDALGLDRMRDWDEIITALRAYRTTAEQLGRGGTIGKQTLQRAVSDVRLMGYVTDAAGFDRMDTWPQILAALREIRATSAEGRPQPPDEEGGQ